MQTGGINCFVVQPAANQLSLLASYSMASCFLGSHIFLPSEADTC